MERSCWKISVWGCLAALVGLTNVWGEDLQGHSGTHQIRHPGAHPIIHPTGHSGGGIPHTSVPTSNSGTTLNSQMGSLQQGVHQGHLHTRPDSVDANSVLHHKSHHHVHNQATHPLGSSLNVNQEVYLNQVMHPAHHSFHHGHWNDNVTNNQIPVVSGLRSNFGSNSPWQPGLLAYNSGYLGYSNPYYHNGYGSYGNYNYSQAIPLNYAPPSQGVSNSAGSVTAALGAFRQANYDAALDLIGRGLVQSPNDAALHELRALALFAKGDYPKAAATIHAVLAAGPGWNWDTLCGIYTDPSLYTAHLRSLESFRNEHPQDAAPRFLLAYHYLVAGHREAAANQLRRVAQFQPNDRVATNLLRSVSPATTEQVAGTGVREVAVQPTTTIKPIGKAVEGTWHAVRDDGSNFELTLTKDAMFDWKFTRKDQSEQFDGTYTVERNILQLKRKLGGTLVAELDSPNDRELNFRLLGSPKEDPGLNFRK